MEKSQSTAYRVGLVAAAIFMVLLAAVYLASLVGLGAAVYLHATMHTVWLDKQGPAIAYMVLLLGGATLFFAMLKPLVAPKAEKARTIPIEAGQAPALFKLISVISRKTGAPLPAVVDLNCDVNARASFAGGLAGMRHGRLTLTIGLPLVAGLSQRQLAGVIAHELGHFNQTGAMRLIWIVGHVDSWFHRATLERDQWDENIVEEIETSGYFAGGVLQAIRGCMWLGRVVLFAFLMAGRAVSLPLLRRMEYEADRSSIEVAGAAAFETMLGRIRELADADKSAWRGLMRIYGSEPLPVDLPGLIAAHSAELAAAADKPRGMRRAGAFDTHPADAQRIAHGKASAGAGLPSADKPASALLPDFEQLCRDATGRRYSMLPPPEYYRASESR